jgi:hypothetical protein
MEGRVAERARGETIVGALANGFSTQLTPYYHACTPLLTISVVKFINSTVNEISLFIDQSMK